MFSLQRGKSYIFLGIGKLYMSTRKKLDIGNRKRAHENNLMSPLINLIK